MKGDDDGASRREMTTIMSLGHYSSNQTDTPSATSLPPLIDSPSQAAGTAQTNAQSGTVNTGGGAGGSGRYPSNITGINGGSGIVILRYESSLTISNPGGGLTFSTATLGSDKVTQFTQGTGTIQFG